LEKEKKSSAEEAFGKGVNLTQKSQKHKKAGTSGKRFITKERGMRKGILGSQALEKKIKGKQGSHLPTYRNQQKKKKKNKGRPQTGGSRESSSFKKSKGYLRAHNGTNCEDEVKTMGGAA